jgi:type IV secretion system protein VirD4
MKQPPMWVKVVAGIALAIVAFALWIRVGAEIFVALAKVDVEPGFLTLYQYWQAYGDRPDVMKHVHAALFVAAAPFGFFAWLIFSKRSGPSLYGEARFAKRKEIEDAGLLGDSGIILGKYGDKYLMYSGDSHVYVAAPTRGGKGVGIVIPNLLSWPESAVVLDIKQENWDITSAVRASYGHACFLFNPAARDGRSHGWNPLSYISEDAGARINDIQKIGAMLWPDPADGGDPIWTASCRSLFLGIVLYLLETPDKQVTLGEVMRFAMQAQAKRLKEMIEKRQASEEPLSSECVVALGDYLDTSDNTRTSIRKSFTSRLELWQNPMIDATTSRNDFDLRDLRRRRMTIYIGITPDDLDRLAPIINLLFQQIIDLNTRELPHQDPTLRYKCLLLMDEFMAPGRIPILAKGISYIAGYNLRILAIFQSPSQVRDPRGGYGHEAGETLFDNMDVRVVFAPSNFRIAEEISKELGVDTIEKKSKGKSGIAFKSKSHSENISEHGRALLLPQEVKAIGAWREILLVRNVPPIQCDKIRYFLDPVFTDRLRAASRLLEDGCKPGKPPTRELLEKAAQTGSLAAPVPVVTPKTNALQEAAAVAMAQVSDTGSRAFTPADLADMHTLALGDFTTDFSGVEIPGAPGEQLTDEQIAALAASFQDHAARAA